MNPPSKNTVNKAVDNLIESIKSDALRLKLDLLKIKQEIEQKIINDEIKKNNE